LGKYGQRRGFSSLYVWHHADDERGYARGKFEPLPRDR
jgi:hypothetical protein